MVLKSEIFWNLIDRFMVVIETGTNFPVLIYDTDGYIIRATVRSRIGDLHPGAQKIMRKEVNEYAVTAAEAAQNPLVREGYSCPIVVDGKILAGFGITGKLELAKPLARTAVKMIDAWIEAVQYQDQLRVSERKYRNLFENASNGIFQASLDGRFFTINPAQARIFGYKTPERMMAEITDIARQVYVRPEDRKIFLQALEREGRLTDFTTQVRRRDGKILDVSIDAHLVREPETGTCYIEGQLADITEKKRMEEMMVQSEKMLSVGGLAAGMAHEINNPLAGMIQSASVMSNRLTGHDQPANRKAAEAAGTTMAAITAFMKTRGILDMLDNIHRSGLRAAEIVANMLSFARKGDAVFSSQDLAALLDQTIDLAGSDYDLKKKYDFRQIAIVREYGDVPPVPCEAAKIQQVILNLFRNGAEAMQDKVVAVAHGTCQETDYQPRFTLRLVHEKEARKVRIEVTDNGPGMDEPTRKRVFEPFFTTKPTDIGTGLGLSVSYFIVTKNHAGEMLVEATPGIGSTFIIRLPVDGGRTI